MTDHGNTSITLGQPGDSPEPENIQFIGSHGTVFLVGRHFSGTGSGASWDFVGSFTSVDEAVRACLSASHFYRPVQLNTPFPLGTNFWSEVTYPNG